MNARLGHCLNVADLQALAARRTPRPIRAFVEGGADDEMTLARNRAAFSDWALVPRALHDVSSVDSTIELFGQRLAWPFFVSPTGIAGLVHPGGEIALARAAARSGAFYCLSTMASRSIEEVAAATAAPKAFQLYLFRDRGLSRELIERAKAAAYAALVLTVDIQVPANREGDRRAGMTIPPRFGLRSLIDFARHPGWCWGQLRHPVRLANFSGDRADPGMPLLSFIAAQFDPSTRWADLEWVRGHWDGPLAIKGLLRAEDASQAADLGASAIILSNHGGRQIDAAISPMDAIEETSQQLAGRAEIVLDGGVRRGTDMLKALTLGASACSTGRVGLYGLAAGGEAGAARAFALLREEYQRDMALLGIRHRSELDRSFVHRLRP